MDIPITVITGTKEDLEEQDIHLWQKETTCKIDFRQMPGRHFFIFKYPTEVIDVITRKLSVYTNEFQS
jgi:surfactin synthase thioesterase subunit